MSERQTILHEALAVVQERQAQYGTREDNFGRIAVMWTAILDHPVSAAEVALCMIALKVARLTFKKQAVTRSSTERAMLNVWRS